MIHLKLKHTHPRLVQVLILMIFLKKKTSSICRLVFKGKHAACFRRDEAVKAELRVVYSKDMLSEVGLGY